MKYDGIFEQVAKKNGVSKEEVKEEIEKGMKEAIDNPEYKSEWDKIKNGKDSITVEEFMDWILSEVSKKL